MAVQSYTETETDLIVWDAASAGDTGSPYTLPPGRGPVTAFQVDGISGDTVTIEGSIDGATYYTLTDLTGASASLTADGIVEISTAVKSIRFSVTGGSGSVVVSMHSQA